MLGSDYEGSPLSVMEAMAADKPAIRTAAGGVPELVGGGCGALVPPRDGEALSKATVYVLENPGARTAMGRALAGRAIERFDMRVMTESYGESYRKAPAGAQTWPEIG